MNPGVTYLPVPSITRAPLGTLTDALGPMAAIRFPRTTIVASVIGEPPLPSMIVAPTMAISVSGDGDPTTRLSALEATVRRAGGEPRRRRL